MNTSDYLSKLEFYDFARGFRDENGEPAPDGPAKAPIFSAEREVESRLQRLREVWGAAQVTARLLSHKYQRMWDGAIVELADQKGTLMVTWRDELSRIMFEGIILGAWESNAEHAHVHALANNQ